MSFFKKLLTNQRRETVHMQASVPANTTEWTDVATFTVGQDATVESLEVWHVPNSEAALRTRPMKKQSQAYASIPEYASDGEQFITGEPDGSTIAADEAVEQGDELVIRAKNLNSNYAYRFRVDVTLDYAGGRQRVLAGGS